MMKNYLKSFSLLMLLCLGLQAHAAAVLSFNSLSTLDSVRVDNLTTNSSVTIKSPFNIALDGSTLPPTLTQVGTIESSVGNTLVYPNPFNNEVFLEHFQQTKGDVNISVCDISGKVVAHFNKSLEQGVHRLNFKPSTPGMYLVKVVDKTVSSSSKLFCLQGGADSPKIEYEGVIENAISKPNYAKSTTDNSLAGIASTGDILRFSGFSLGNVTTLYDLASTSKSYTFTFGARNFNIKNYYLLASKPCLVDIMFSVTDAKNKGIDYLNNSDFTVSEDNATASPTETFRFVRKMQQLPAKIKTVLLLDISTSVGADIETIKAAATKFVQSIYDKQEVAIYTFSDAPVLLQNFTTDKTLLQNAIKGITLGFPSTNLYGSTVTALAKWTDIYSLTGLVQGSLVLFTDGSDTQGSSMLNDVTLARGDKRIYVIGLGSEINPTALNQIANPGPYFPIAKATELDAVFASIQSDIVQFANSFYWLNYMTPKRTGTHSLKVEVKNNTNTDALTSYLNGSFSALGFSSVTSGVFINKEDTRLYGLDTIRCFSSATGYTFAYDKNGINQYGKDSLVLTPTTYWANKPPVYSWTNSKSAACTLQPSVYSLATLFSTVTKGDTAIVNIKDEANGYSKNVVLVICPDFAELTTAIPKNTSFTTVTLGGEVTNIGRTDLTARGVCYATTVGPTIANSKIAIGLGKGVFETPVTGLAKATKYYARAYATNTAGTAYGNEQTFTTLANLPVITLTTAITNKTATTATCGGVISSDEGAAVTARGVCWSTSPSPTTTDNKTTDGSGTGTYISAITGLVGGVTYYVRAYATNSIGTAYGTEVSFSTIPAITTTAISAITATTATSGGNVTAIGGAAVTARGICWSTTPSPTIALTTKTSDGTGIGTFTSAITGLVGGTIYYVRAYATNSIGTAYGAEISFGTIPTITTSAISSITATTATGGGNVTAIGGAAVTARGVCWSTSSSPTIALTTKTSDGTGIGTYTSSITGLTIGTTYFLRAYATNSIGTVYGAEVSFSTALPTATTTAISAITATTATCGGNVTAIGGAAVTERGICWGAATNPTIALTTKTSDGTGVGTFTSAITGLTVGTTYYVRAYATNSIGTTYGAVVSFSTALPTVTTSAISAVTGTTATCGGNVTSIGGAAVTARGVCWSTNTNPTTANSKTSDGTGIGTFTSTITGLTGGTIYYVRAYTTNSISTTYGAEMSFSTIPAVTTTPISAITATTATSGGEVTSIGGAAVTARGVCWSTAPNPTTALTTKTSDGTGIGTYTSSITGLVIGTTYYVRAYATNSIGTAYGAEISFSPTPFVITAAISAITASTATSGGNVISTGGAAVTARGVCWSTTRSPTVSDNKTIDGTGTGVFTSSITGLTIGNTYYLRAYATNSIGTAYGEEVSYSTALPTVTTNAISSVTATTASCGGNVTLTGGTALTARGVCWSTTTCPTTALTTKTSDGTGIGAFTSAITGLTGGTTYYVRAYATNSIGTTYGAEVNFVFYPIGTSYLGGKIAYLDASGIHGFVCALKDASSMCQWYNGNLVATGATYTSGVYGGISKTVGRMNTEAIIAVQGAGTYAASICARLTTGGASAGDWYLPTISELNVMYKNKDLLGIYSNNYWSSSELDYKSAYSQDFGNGSEGIRPLKSNQYSVRAVRAF